MYSRKVTAPPPCLVKKGRPLFGTFAGSPRQLDIRGVEAPFGGLPLPRFITNFRIKSSLMFMFNIGPYIGSIDFFDAKLFGYAEVVFWNRETMRKFAYRAIMGPRRRFVPHRLFAGFCASFHKSRYIRVSWDRSRDRISIIFNLTGDSVRPGAQAAFLVHYSEPGMGEVTTVTPAPTRSRCSATYVITSTLHGALSLEATKLSSPVTMQDTNGQAMLEINRTYYNFITEIEYVTAIGMINGKQISFRLVTTSDDAVDTENYNDDILFVDGVCTPLPPVCITHPFGLIGQEHPWIIQDTENMVDLTFTPKSDNFRNMSFFAIRTQYHTIYGTFEGVLKTKDGESITFHNFPGIAKNQLLRL